MATCIHVLLVAGIWARLTVWCFCGDAWMEVTTLPALQVCVTSLFLAEVHDMVLLGNACMDVGADNIASCASLCDFC